MRSPHELDLLILGALCCVVAWGAIYQGNDTVWAIASAGALLAIVVVTIGKLRGSR